MERRPPRIKGHRFTKVCYYRNGGIGFLEKYFYKDRAFIKMEGILLQKEPELYNK